MDLVFGLHDDKRSPAASEERPHDAKDSLRWAMQLGLVSFDSLQTPVLLGISQDLSAGVAIWANSSSRIGYQGCVFHRGVINTILAFCLFS